MTFQSQQVAPDAADLILQAQRLAVDDLGASGRLFFRFNQNGTAVGFGGFEAHGKHSLIVNRSKGERGPAVAATRQSAKQSEGTA